MTESTETANDEQQLSTADLVSGKSNSDQERGTGPDSDAERATPLFAEDELDDLRTRWRDVQASFVDDPRKAVESADNLVATMIKRLAELFANERQTMEQQWGQGGDVSTDDLRLALQRYRSFFDRLLSA